MKITFTRSLTTLIVFMCFAGSAFAQIPTTSPYTVIFRVDNPSTIDGEYPYGAPVDWGDTLINSVSGQAVWAYGPDTTNMNAMRAFAYQNLKAKKIELIFEADTSLDSLSLPMQVRKNFYLIFKEVTNNMVKYSNAHRAAIKMTYAHHHLHLQIRDDGIGFDTEDICEGNGIKNMKRRANEIRGTLTINSAPGRGTTTELFVRL